MAIPVVAFITFANRIVRMQLLKPILFLSLTVFLNGYLTVHTLSSHTSLFFHEASTSSCSHHHHDASDEEGEQSDSCDICEVDLQVLYPAALLVLPVRPAGRMPGTSAYKERAKHATPLGLPELRGPPAVS